VIEKDDWRLTNQRDYLSDVALKQIPWKTKQPDWDHDHCVFCWDTIDENVTDAYCTKDERIWICKACFEDFKEEFNWSIEK
jgi:hypothetical protein